MNDYIADRIALQDVMTTYAAAVDDRDYELYRSIFTEDVHIVGFGQTEFDNLDDWFEWWKPAIDNYGPTQHMLSPMLATIDGDSASTRSDVRAHHYLKDKPDTTVTLWATYKTDMVRRESGWKICRHELIVRGSRTQTG